MNAMLNARRSILLFRLCLVALALVYILTVHRELVPGELSREATEYEQIAWQVSDGFSLYYGLQKIVLLIGNIAAALGIALGLFRHRFARIPLLVSAPLLLIAALSGAPEAAFPQIEDRLTLVLWCVTSAMWGASQCSLRSGAECCSSRPELEMICREIPYPLANGVMQCVTGCKRGLAISPILAPPSTCG
jgi:hypothetical protein